MLLERGIRDISRVLAVACNSVYSARSVRHGPACLVNGGAPIVSLESFNFIILKAIFGRFFSGKMLFHMKTKRILHFERG